MGSDGDVRVSVVEEFKRCLLVTVVSSVGGFDETASFPSSSFSLLGAIFECGY
jgi:hypothetical protein